jgi:prepilin-type N-terminal cleavage/methylation domain-containing protein
MTLALLREPTYTRFVRRKGGFTLIELMIVVAIIGILAAIAIPKFAELIRKSSEGASKGNLGSIRSSLSIYYGDMEGQYPGQLSGLTVSGKYLASIPVAKMPNYHADNSVEHDYNGGCQPFMANDFATWGYCAFSSDPGFGGVNVQCTHTDTKGTMWTSY